MPDELSDPVQDTDFGVFQLAERIVHQRVSKVRVAAVPTGQQPEEQRNGDATPEHRKQEGVYVLLPRALN